MSKPDRPSDWDTLALSYIMARDHITVEKAREIFAAMTVADKTLLELEMKNPNNPVETYYSSGESGNFTADYDPFAR